MTLMPSEWLVIGEDLTSKMDQTRKNAQRCLEGRRTLAPFTRRTLFNYLSDTDVPRRLEAERIFGRAHYFFAYRVMEGDTVTEEGECESWLCD